MLAPGPTDNRRVTIIGRSTGVFAILGIIVVLGSVLGGFAMAHGPFAVLLAWSEWVVIVGTAVGTVLISTPKSVLGHLTKKIPRVFTGAAPSKEGYLDVLRLLFELFQLARRDGLIAIESHIERPEESSVFKKYPSISNDHHAVEFLCDALRTVLAGSVPAYDLEAMLEAEIEVHHDEDAKTVAALTRVADALPGIGIVAAVLGIVVTMQAIAGPIEEIGHHVASALVGTFLGVFLAYGLVGPFGNRMKEVVEEEGAFYRIIQAVLVAHLHGNAAQISVEIGRGNVPSGAQPSFLELEEALSAIPNEA